MQALVYEGPGQKSLQDRPKPTLQLPPDAVIRISKTTLCGTDLHILKGDVATCKAGTILGHEGVGVVDSVGSGVVSFKPGVFTVEYSVRVAQMAVYQLLGIERKVPPITAHDKSLRTQFETLIKALK